MKIEFEAAFNAWMSGVPTESNIADDPPRGDCKYVASLGCVRTEIDVDLVWNDVQDFHTKGGATTSSAAHHS